MHVECEVSGDVSLVAAVARVAAALILRQRCDRAGDVPPGNVDWVVDSQSLAAIAAPAASLVDKKDYNYRGALAACHRAHVQMARSAVGQGAYEQNIWLRVLIVVRNQIEMIRQMCCGLQPGRILVEGDLDFARH